MTKASDRNAENMEMDRPKSNPSSSIIGTRKKLRTSTMPSIEAVNNLDGGLVKYLSLSPMSYNSRRNSTELNRVINDSRGGCQSSRASCNPVNTEFRKSHESSQIGNISSSPSFIKSAESTTTNRSNSKLSSPLGKLSLTPRISSISREAIEGNVLKTSDRNKSPSDMVGIKKISAVLKSPTVDYHEDSKKFFVSSSPTIKSSSKKISKTANKSKTESSPKVITSPFSLSLKHNRSPFSGGKSPPNGCDRFIPNRTSMNMPVCRASVLRASVANQAFARAEDQALARFQENIENAFPNDRNGGLQGMNASAGSGARLPAGASNETANTTTPVVQSPLRLEFQRRMRGALLPVNPGEDESGGMTNSSNRVLSSHDDVPDPFMENSMSNTDGNRISGPRMLRFNDTNNRPNSNSQLFGIRSYSAGGSYSEDVAEEDGGSVMRSVYSSPRTGITANETINTSTSPSTTLNPFAYDTLHVLWSSRNYVSPGGGDSILTPRTRCAAAVGRRAGRSIPTAPTRILDAPELVDDYYLNLVSWGMNNILAVALGQCVYLWDASTGGIEHLLTLEGPDDYVTSVSWASSTNGGICEQRSFSDYIAVGTNSSAVQIWDTKAQKLVRTMNGHSARVGALAWNSKNWLSSGGRDSLVIQHDIRASDHQAATYIAHTQEVCGLKWNEDGSTLASGGNENYLCLWDAAMSSSLRQGARNTNFNVGNVSPRLILSQHQAAVKALAWCPFHRNLLASGGGTADRTIKFWNCNSGSVLNSIDTGSQVCSLLWSKYNKEICSSHGFSENQLCLWSYPTMTKIQEFTGHSARVLHMEQSPDGSCVVSAAADETLRFWDVFGSPPSSRKAISLGSFATTLSSIR